MSTQTQCSPACAVPKEQQGVAECSGTSKPVYRPVVDIIETKDAIVLVAEVPGVDENSADVTLDKNVLTIRGSVQPVLFEGYSLVAAEYGVGDFERSFTVSQDVAADRIEASVKDGVLRVTLPKATPPESRQICIKAG